MAKLCEFFFLFLSMTYKNTLYTVKNQVHTPFQERRWEHSKAKVQKYVVWLCTQAAHTEKQSVYLQIHLFKGLKRVRSTTRQTRPNQGIGARLSIQLLKLNLGVIQWLEAKKQLTSLWAAMASFRDCTVKLSEMGSCSWACTYKHTHQHIISTCDAHASILN